VISPTLGVRLQTSWRDIIDAERQRGAALADAANVAAAQLAYEAALERFRHNQIELFTVALGNLELLREHAEATNVALIRLTGEVAMLRETMERHHGTR
jgi:hypothetical protein